MSRFQFGLLCCLAFVTLEAYQAVYLGSIFQDVDSFLIGAWVFGISVVGTVLITALLRPAELVASIRAIRLVVALNLFAALTWGTYFIAVQLIEPAVVFTVFSGMMPLGTIIAAWLRIAEASLPRKRLVQIGNTLILLSIVVLAATTIAGFSGFVRGGIKEAALGVGLSALSGGCTAFVILCSVRLNARGVGPMAQFGLRFVLYTFLALGALWIGIDQKTDPIPAFDLTILVAIGLIVIALPLYLVQKAVPLLPAATIAAMTALGPVMVFAMQLIEGRVDYAPTTLVGLAIYVSGAIVAVWGATRDRREMPIGA